jgi:OmcA/MtrC family decaheme c-type cytochrome
MEPGKTPTVAIKLTNSDGTAVDGSKLATFAPMMAGPTSSYRRYFREAGAARAQFDAATGNTLYTFTAKVPDDATGTWTISGDFYRNATIQRAVPDDEGNTTVTLREAAFNPIKYVGLSGEEAVEPRRQAVTTALCNSCHDRLALHGGQRLNVDECVICHNPHETDAARRPADQSPAQSISFQYMIHRIHRGHNLTRDFTVYGFGNTAHHYNEVTFPGDLRNCVKCHVAGSFIPPIAGDAVTAPREFFSPMGSATTACLGCHDDRDAAAHAFLNTTQFGGQPAEACGACHGAGSVYAADKVHAR